MKFTKTFWVIIIIIVVIFIAVLFIIYLDRINPFCSSLSEEKCDKSIFCEIKYLLPKTKIDPVSGIEAPHSGFYKKCLGK